MQICMRIFLHGMCTKSYTRASSSSKEKKFLIIVLQRRNRKSGYMVLTISLLSLLRRNSLLQFWPLYAICYVKEFLSNTAANCTCQLNLFKFFSFPLPDFSDINCFMVVSAMPKIKIWSA
jgi:hypothetical protein